MIPALLTVILFLIYAGLILFYAIQWKKLKTYTKKNSEETPALSLTIIIPARNEAGNITNLLHSIIVQDYPAHLRQVIVVDDHSTDDTADEVRAFSEQNVMLVELKDFITGKINAYKKKAIEVALAKSTGVLIITTDADCIAPANWLKAIASFYQEKKPAFIAMPVLFSRDHSALEIFQSLDFMTLQGVTGGSVQAGAASMCNGANLAYTREAFYAVNGFEGIDQVASGDDMLLMHKIARQYPGKISFLKSPEVIIQTAPMPDLRSFFNQRIRWASKADEYDDKRITVVLAIIYLFNVSMFFIPLVSIFYNPIIFHTFTLFQFWLLIFILKIIVELIFLFPVARFFGKQKLLVFFPLAEPFHIIYTLIAGWLGKFGKYSWKGRVVK